MSERKKQYSLTLLLRVFLTILIIVSIAVFIGGVMRFNELKREQEALEKNRDALIEEKEELQELLGSENDENFIVRMARKFWGLFFPDEELYYNNQGS